MDFKRMIFLLLSSMPLICASQKCPLLEKNTMLKQRSYFVLDSILQLNLSNVLPNIDSQDTSLVKDIIGKGKEDDDYMTFFESQGIAIKKIGLDQFSSFKKDTSLTKKDRRILKQQEKLYQQYLDVDSLNPERIIIAVNKKLNKPKFKKLQNKLDSRTPVLFKMYPIYRYKNKILLMYLISFNMRTSFLYEICEKGE